MAKSMKEKKMKTNKKRNKYQGVVVNGQEHDHIIKCVMHIMHTGIDNRNVLSTIHVGGMKSIYIRSVYVHAAVYNIIYHTVYGICSAICVVA